MPAKGSGVSPTKRFWSKVTKAGPDDCWPWTGTVTKPDPYPIMWDGTLNHNGNPHMVRAARWAAVHIFGWTLTPKIHVLHTCNVSICCNPAHWYPGSHSDNMRDRARAGYTPVNKKASSTGGGSP